MLQRQGLQPLPTAALSGAPAALAALGANIAAATVAVQLDRAYAALEGELLALLSPQPGGGHGGGGGSVLESAALVAGADGAGGEPAGGGSKAAEAQLGGLIAQLAASERSLREAQAALDAAGAGPPAGPPDGAGEAAARPLECAQREAGLLLARLGLAVPADEPGPPSALEPARPLPAVALALGGVLGRLRRGLAFYGRGFQILFQDLRLAGTLVARAARGHTLTQREARAVRRTAKDAVMLVPFTVLLLLPLSPLGHVLVFSFLQRVWPGFFPTAFTDSRQGMLELYSSLLLSSQRAGAGEGARGAGGAGPPAEAQAVGTPAVRALP